MTEASQKPVLITFPPSLDSELARFLLKHYGIEQQDQPHALIFRFFVTLWHARTIIFPVLCSNSFKLIGPRPIASAISSASQCKAMFVSFPFPGRWLAASFEGATEVHGNALCPYQRSNRIRRIGKNSPDMRMSLEWLWHCHGYQIRNAYP
jgi:hypothetical protein